MADMSFTDWERRIFQIMAFPRNENLGELLSELENSPPQISASLHTMIIRHIGFHFENMGEAPACRLPSAFEDACAQETEERTVLSLVEDCQGIQMYKDNLDHFDRHLMLVAFILNSESLMKEKSFLTYVLEEITHEVQSSLIEFRTDIQNGEGEIPLQDLNLFDWCCQRLAKLASR